MSTMLKQKLIDIANGFTKYGLWKGGGSGGSSALSDMTDVTLSNLQANNILKYNGSVWVNDKILHEYSTEEKIVGKWIDGKPIYEKVISFPLSGSGSLSYPHNIENLKNIHFISMLHNTTENGIKTTRTYAPWYNNASVYINEITTTDITIYHISNRTEFYELILRYTKTTD